MALNFWWGGGRFFSLEELGRVPSAVHRSIFRRLRSLVLADGPREVFDIASSGRRFPQLSARLNERSAVLTKLGIGGGPYARAFPGHDVPLDNSALPELEPYKDLDASRLKVVGQGGWDATEFLDDDLCMPYRFPDILLLPGVVPNASQYCSRVDPADEVLKLAKLWDTRTIVFASV